MIDCLPAEPANTYQTITKGFASVGYKTQVQPLSHFQEDYGLKADGDEEESESAEEEDDGETDESGSEGSED
jgi:hypothetical protein